MATPIDRSARLSMPIEAASRAETPSQPNTIGAR
jgi:hypothetical protein